MVPDPTSLDGVLGVATDSGRSERGRGMWEPLELSKSGSLPLPIVLLGVPLKVPVCDILMPGGERHNKEGRGRGERGEERGEANRGERKSWYEGKHSKGVCPAYEREKKRVDVGRSSTRGVRDARTGVV